MTGSEIQTYYAHFHIIFQCYMTGPEILTYGYENYLLGPPCSVRHCWKQNFLSNPRRIHSGKEDEEKEEQGLLGAPICFSPAPPPPSPPPHCASVAPPGAALSGLAERRLLPLPTAPPPLWPKTSDFQG